MTQWAHVIHVISAQVVARVDLRSTCGLLLAALAIQWVHSKRNVIVKPRRSIQVRILGRKLLAVQRDSPRFTHMRLVRDERQDEQVDNGGVQLVICL